MSAAIELIVSKSTTTRIASGASVRISLKLLAQETREFVRVDVHCLGDTKDDYIGGAEFCLDEIPSLVSIAYHTGTAERGIGEDIISAITQAVAPMVGQCIGLEPRRRRSSIRKRIKLAAQSMLTAGAASLSAVRNLDPELSVLQPNERASEDEPFARRAGEHAILSMGNIIHVRHRLPQGARVAMGNVVYVEFRGRDCTASSAAGKALAVPRTPVA